MFGNFYKYSLSVFLHMKLKALKKSYNFPSQELESGSPNHVWRLHLHPSASRLSWKLCGKSFSFFRCAAIRSGRNEVKNVLKFWKICGCKIFKELEKLFWKITASISLPCWWNFFSPLPLPSNWWFFECWQEGRVLESGRCENYENWTFVGSEKWNISGDKIS